MPDESKNPEGISPLAPPPGLDASRFDLLEDAGLNIEAHALPDHADIAAGDLAFDEPGPVLVTEKDAVKCRAFAHDDVWCVAVDLTFAPDTATRLMRVLLPEIGGADGH